MYWQFTATVFSAVVLVLLVIEPGLLIVLNKCAFIPLKSAVISA